MSHEDRVVDTYSLCVVVTSDSVYRGEKRDLIKDVVHNVLEQEVCRGAQLLKYVILPNDLDKIRDTVAQFSNTCDVILITGGTGLSSKDVSIEAVKGIATKELPGVGEFFRYVSYLEIGPRAILSRASAYVVGKSLVVVSPGSPNAVEIMLKHIVCRIAPHAVYELRR